jgi:hypothetical protein
MARSLTALKKNFWQVWAKAQWLFLNTFYYWGVPTIMVVGLLSRPRSPMVDWLIAKAMGGEVPK